MEMLPASASKANSDLERDGEESPASELCILPSPELITLSDDEALDQTNLVYPETLPSSDSSDASTSGAIPNVATFEVKGTLANDSGVNQGRHEIDGLATDGVIISTTPIPITASPEVITLSDEEAPNPTPPRQSLGTGDPADTEIIPGTLAPPPPVASVLSDGPPLILAGQPKRSSSRARVRSDISKSNLIVALGLTALTMNCPPRLTRQQSRKSLLSGDVEDITRGIATTKPATPLLPTRKMPKRKAKKGPAGPVTRAKKRCQGKGSVDGFQQGPGPSGMTSSRDDSANDSDKDKDSAGKKSQVDFDIDE